MTKSEAYQTDAGCSYVRPLIGYPKREVQRLAARYLEVRYGETGQIRSGDCEHEIRGELESRGITVSSLFPPNHEQSLVTALRSSGEHNEQSFKVPEDPAF